MHCRNCGASVAENAEVCLSCGVRPLNGNKFCQQCGAETTPEQEICLKCGVRLRGAGGVFGGVDSFEALFDTRRTITNPECIDPILAGLLSGCCVAGLGQIVLGQVIKGLVLMVISIGVAVFTLGIGGVPLWIVMGVDAYLIARKLREGRPVGQWEFF